MKNKKKWLIGLLVAGACGSAFAGLFSTAGKDDDCTESRSRAWCLLDLAGASMGVNDAKSDAGMSFSVPLATDFGKTMDNASDAVVVVAAVGKATGAALPMPGLSGGASGVMTLIGLLRPSQQYVSVPKGFALVPASVAGAGEARAAVMEKIKTALLSAFEVSIEAPVKGRSEAFTDQIKWETHAPASGGLCGESVCAFSSGALEDSATYVDVRPPKWAGEERLSLSRAMATPILFSGKKWVINNDTAWARFSAAMPDWYYIYLPPNNERAFPVLLNKGEALYFLTPQKG